MGAFAGWIVAGLGNPGPRYAGTRHDAGFMLADRLAEAAQASWQVETDSHLTRPARIAGAGPAILVKPMRYMNVSGPPLQRLLTRERVSPERLLVLVDDINLPLGKLRLRPEGTAGGHNGLTSIIGCIGQAFPRLRLGVGKEPAGMDRADWVLSRFAPGERPEVEAMLERAGRVVEAVLSDGLEAAARLAT